MGLSLRYSQGAPGPPFSRGPEGGAVSLPCPAPGRGPTSPLPASPATAPPPTLSLLPPACGGSKLAPISRENLPVSGPLT